MDQIMKKSSQPERESSREPGFHGGAIIDEQGREIPITEAMIQRACRMLEHEGLSFRVPPVQRA